MLDQTYLLELAGILAASTAVAAATPLVLSPSPRMTACISTISSGILVGAALFVVIPEGVDQVYRAKAGKVAFGTTRTWVGIALLAGFILM
jgi:zinc transporter 9